MSETTRVFNPELPRAHIHPSQVGELLKRLSIVAYSVKDDGERNVTWEWARVNWIAGELKTLAEGFERIMDEDLGGWPYGGKSTLEPAAENTPTAAPHEH